MKAPRRTLRIALLLLLGAVGMGAGWLVRTAVEIEPPASAAEGISPDGIFDEWRVLELFHLEAPSGQIGAQESLFGSCGSRLEIESLDLTVEGLETLFGPAGLASTGTEDDADVRDSLIGPWFPGSPAEEEREAPPTLPSILVPLEPEDPAPPLARLPECGQRPLW